MERRGGSAGLRDHSRAYRALRASLLDREPLCRYCRNRDGRIVPATVLDHLVSLALGGSNDASNLVPACHPCNAAKAVDEQRYLQCGYDTRDLACDPAMREWMRLAAPIREDD